MFLANVGKDAKTTFLHSTAAANTATVRALAPDPLQVWAIDTVYFSYSGAPTAGSITITVNGVTVLQHAITAGGVGFIPFRSADDEGIYGNKNEAVVITLAAGGAGIVGNLTVKYR